MEKLRLYHVGFQEIREPDVHFGRKNADFGQGFYLTPDGEFAKRWATERTGCSTYLNIYELTTDGLNIVDFNRDGVWYDYIFRNRRGQEDSLSGIDVVSGPIANDIIYDVMGILTSGMLDRDLSLRMLQTGPEYRQVVMKTEKAVSNLTWLSSEILEHDVIVRYRESVRLEEEKFQEQIASMINDMT